jgi:hypothetical protein
MEHLNTEQKKMLDIIQSESQDTETDVGQPQSNASGVF